MKKDDPKELRQQAKWTRIFAEMKCAEAAQMDKAAEAAEQLAAALEMGAAMLAPQIRKEVA